MAMFAAFPSTIMEAAFGRLHNSGGPPSAAPHCCGFHNGGWGDKRLEKVDETLLKHVAIVSKTFHQLYPATYHFLKYISTVLVLATWTLPPPCQDCENSQCRVPATPPPLQDWILYWINKKTVSTLTDSESNACLYVFQTFFHISCFLGACKC